METMTYQSRSADEAPETLSVCLVCRLDPGGVLKCIEGVRLVDSSVPVALSRIPLLPLLSPPVIVDSHSSTPSKEVELRMSSDLASRLLGGILHTGLSVTRETTTQVQCTMTLDLEDRGMTSYNTRARSNEGPVHKRQLSLLLIAPGITTLSEAIEVPAAYDATLWSRHREHSIERIELITAEIRVEGLHLRLASHEPSGIISGKVELHPSTGLDSTLVPRVLSRLLELGCYYTDLSRTMGTEMINDLVTLSMPAVDTETVQKSGYKFTSKPDGERLWAVLCGSVWFYLRALAKALA